jgi:aerobic-type carbon monoxide dehydrogenase small subunit (CoxS/CutS family)
MLMTCTDMLQKYPLENDAQIRDGLSGNLCRCTGYTHIVEAVRIERDRRDAKQVEIAAEQAQ